MKTNKELLNDTTFDREIAPKDNISDLLVNLIKNKAFDEKSALQISNCLPNRLSLYVLIKQDKIEIFSKDPQNTLGIYLTKLGKIVAFGEVSLRAREEGLTINEFMNKE
jgi:hypothetical protein